MNADISLILNLCVTALKQAGFTTRPHSKRVMCVNPDQCTYSVAQKVVDALNGCADVFGLAFLVETPSLVEAKSIKGKIQYCIEYTANTLSVNMVFVIVDSQAYILFYAKSF